MTQPDATGETARRPYAPPRLTIYGPLPVLTQTNVTMNMSDMVPGRMT